MTESELHTKNVNKRMIAYCLLAAAGMSLGYVLVALISQYWMFIFGGLGSGVVGWIMLKQTIEPAQTDLPRKDVTPMG